MIGTHFDDRLGADCDGTALLGGRGDDQLTGQAGDDILYRQLGRDTLVGDGGDDFMAGGSGSDMLAGGAGADRFGWDIDAFGGRDLVTDFSSDQGDKISLDALGPLAFIGEPRFTGDGAGEVRGEQTLVFVDTDGDKHADFSIVLTGAHTLQASDFVLASASDLPS